MRRSATILIVSRKDSRRIANEEELLASVRAAVADLPPPRQPLAKNQAEDSAKPPPPAAAPATPASEGACKDGEDSERALGAVRWQVEAIDLDGMTLPQQINRMSSASVVVAMHGAALTHMYVYI
jgi:hypothetical protein